MSSTIDAAATSAGKDAQILGDTAAAAALPPQFALAQMLTGYWVSQALYVAVRLGIFDQLAAGPHSAAQLAAATGTHTPSLYRLLRALASVGLLATQPGDRRRFFLTPQSEVLRSGPGSMASMVLHVGEQPTWRAWGGLLESVKTGDVAFERENGASWVEYYREHPESGGPFYQAMTETSQAVSAALAQVYEFCGAHTIVDVGGGHGYLLASVLQEHPTTRGIVFDLPSVMEGARKQIAAAGLAERCTAIEGDFFQSIPSADLYILKYILHDWNDEQSVQILKTIHRCAEPGARVLLVESVVPEGDGPDLSKWGDLHMLIMTGGRERTVSEYQALFQAGGFALTRVLATPTPLSVIEAVRIA